MHNFMILVKLCHIRDFDEIAEHEFVNSVVCKNGFKSVTLMILRKLCFVNNVFNLIWAIC